MLCYRSTRRAAQRTRLLRKRRSALSVLTEMLERAKESELGHSELKSLLRYAEHLTYDQQGQVVDLLEGKSRPVKVTSRCTA